MHVPDTNAAAGESRYTIAAEISGLGAEPSKRHFRRQRSDVLAHVGRIVIKAGRRDPAGCDRVDAHRRPFERCGLGEIHHAGARRAGVAHVRHAVPHVGDHVHDRAAVLLHPLHVGLARDEEATGEVGAHHGIPALRRNLLQRRRELPARVVDEEIDAAEVGGDGAHGLGDALLLADVDRVAACAAAGVRDLARNRVKFLWSAADQRDLRAKRRQLMRRAAADAAAGPGHNAGLAREQACAEDGSIGSGHGWRNRKKGCRTGSSRLNAIYQANAW